MNLSPLSFFLSYPIYEITLKKYSPNILEEYSGTVFFSFVDCNVSFLQACGSNIWLNVSELKT